MRRLLNRDLRKFTYCITFEDNNGYKYRPDSEKLFEYHAIFLVTTETTMLLTIVDHHTILNHCATVAKLQVVFLYARYRVK